MKLFDMIVASKVLGGGGGVTPTGTINITQNGDADVTNYATAHVAVPQPSGKITISQNGTDIDVSQYATADVSVSGGGGSSYTLIGSAEFEVSTESTANNPVGEVAIDETKWADDKFLCIYVYDKAGAREGYFYASCAFMPKITNMAMSPPLFGLKASSDGVFSGFKSQYGVYAGMVSLGSSPKVNIRATYNSSSSGIIDGTYVCEVYAVPYPS